VQTYSVKLNTCGRNDAKKVVYFCGKEAEQCLWAESGSRSVSYYFKRADAKFLAGKFSSPYKITDKIKEKNHHSLNILSNIYKYC